MDSLHRISSRSQLTMANMFVAADSNTNTLCDGAASTTGFVNQYQEPGWHYLSIDLSAYKGLICLEITTSFSSTFPTVTVRLTIIITTSTSPTTADTSCMWTISPLTIP